MVEVQFDFSGKNFLVTGASSGMGKEIASEIAVSGGTVLAMARNAERLADLQAQYPNQIVTGVVPDICDANAVQAVVDDFVAVHGKLSGMVHAAGILLFTPLKAYDESEAKKMMDISFWSSAALVRMLQKKKYSEDGASFVLFSSVSGISGEPGMFAYSATKAAIRNLVRSLAPEIARRGLRINAICPGRVKTPMTEGPVSEDVVKRHLLGEGEPADVAGVALFMLSDRARWMTGTDVVVDGGYLAN